jgi:hypothetical protein
MTELERAVCERNEAENTYLMYRYEMDVSDQDTDDAYDAFQAAEARLEALLAQEV